MAPAQEKQRAPASEPATRRDRQAHAIRADLLRAGRTLFTTQGFAATTIRQLCTEAGTTRGGLTHHFPTKTELFHAVVGDLTLDLARDLKRAIDAAEEPGLPKLRAACEAALRFYMDPSPARILLRELPAVSMPSSDAIDGFFHQLSQGLVALFPKGQLGFDPGHVTAVIQGVIPSLATLVLSSNNREASLVTAIRTMNRVLEALVTPGAAV